MMKSPPGTTMNTADESNIFLHSKVQERVDDPHYVHKEISNVSTPRKEFFSTPNRECQQSALPDVSQKSGRDKEQQQLHKGRGSQSQNTFQVSTCSADISCGSKSDIIPTAENDRDDDVQPVNKRPKPVFQYSGLGEGLTKAEEKQLCHWCQCTSYPEQMFLSTRHFLNKLRSAQSMPWIPGSFPAWAAAAAFLIDQSVTSEQIVQSRNVVPLSQVLRHFQINFFDFNEAVTAIINLCNVDTLDLPRIHLALQQRIKDIKWVYTLDSILREKLMEIVPIFFSKTYLKNDTGSSTVAFIWLSYLVTREINIIDMGLQGITPSAIQTPSLLTLDRRIVLCALHHIIQHCAQIDGLVLQGISRPFTNHSKHENVPVSLLHMAQRLEVDSDLIKVVYRTYWLHFLSSYASKIVLSAMRGIPTQQTLDFLNATYERCYMDPRNCHLDERLVLVRDCQLFNLPPQSPRYFSIPEAFYDQTRSPQVKLHQTLSPHPPKTRSQIRSQGNLSSPQKSCLNRSLQQFLHYDAGLRPSVYLASMLIDIDGLDQVSAVIDAAKTAFSVSVRASSPTENAESFSEQWYTTVRLVYKIIEETMCAEIAEMRETMMTAIVRPSNIRGFIAFSFRIAQIITGFTTSRPISQYHDLLWILKTFDASPVVFWKVTERAMADFFVHFPEVAAPVAETERFLLSQVLWLSDYKTVCTFSCGLPRVCDTNRAVASSGSSVDTQRQASTIPNVTPSHMDETSATSVSISLNATSSKQKGTSSVTARLLAHKFYDVMFKRLTILYQLGQQQSPKIKRMTWTLFEYMAVEKPYLFEDRNADQLLLCCMYMVLKVHRSRDVRFFNLLVDYGRLVDGQLQLETIEQVRMPTIQTSQKKQQENQSLSLSHGSDTARNTTSILNGLPHIKDTRNQHQVKEQTTEYYAHIYSFYNNVIVPELHGFFIRFGSGEDNEPRTADYPRPTRTISAPTQIKMHASTIRMRHLPMFSPLIQQKLPKLPSPHVFRESSSDFAKQNLQSKRNIQSITSSPSQPSSSIPKLP
eukprot:gene11120-3181_t